jgi:hypothetical protein
MLNCTAYPLAAIGSTPGCGCWRRPLLMSEYRPGSGREVRILLVFDPWRSAALLVAGDKSGQPARWVPAPPGRQCIGHDRAGQPRPIPGLRAAPDLRTQPLPDDVARR